MEARAPYRPEAPKGPRNLAVPLVAWLRTQGFTATEQVFDTLTTVQAHWIAVSGERFEFTYTWASGPVPEASCTLRVLYPRVVWLETLFTAQHVRRLKEARLLVNNCVRLANA